MPYWDFLSGQEVLGQDPEAEFSTLPSGVIDVCAELEWVRVTPAGVSVQHCQLAAAHLARYLRWSPVQGGLDLNQPEYFGSCRL